MGLGHRFLHKNTDNVLTMVEEVLVPGVKEPTVAWFGPVLMVLIHQPEDLHVVLNSDQCLSKPYMYRLTRNETGLFTSKRDDWRLHRRTLNPTFNLKMLMSFIPTFNEKARTMVDRMQPDISKPVDMYRVTFKCLLDMEMNTLLGWESDSQNRFGDMLYENFEEFMKHVTNRLMRFWLKWDWVYRFTDGWRSEMKCYTSGDGVFKYIRDEKQREFAEKGNIVLDEYRQANMLPWLEKCLLMQQDGKFSNENVMDEIYTAFGAGPDTAGSSLMSTLLMLAIHQDIQEKVVAELREIFDTPDTPVTYDDIVRMPYMEMVIKEAMRHFPVGPFMMRECDEDLPFRGGVLPKGTNIGIVTLKVHHDPDIWGPNVDRFYPEHFLPENVAQRHPCSYLAFSAGKRNCIAIRYAWFAMKIMLAHLLRRYKFTTDLTYEQIQIKMHLVLRIGNENALSYVPR